MSKTNIVLIIFVLILGGIILVGDVKVEVVLGEDEPAENSDSAVVTPVAKVLSFADQAIYNEFLSRERDDLSGVSLEGLDFIISALEPESETWICVPNLVTNLFHDGFIRELTTGLEGSGIKINSALGWRYSGLFDGTLKESCRVLPSYNLVTCVTEVDENTGPYTDVVHLDTATMVYNHTQIREEGTTFTSGSCEIDVPL